MNDYSLEELLKCLEEEDEFLWQDVATQLGEMKEPRAIVPLIEALKKVEIPGTAWLILDALKEIGDQAIDPLANLIIEEDPVTSNIDFEEVADTLAEMGDAARERLLRIYEEGNERIKRFIAKSVGKLKDKRAVAVLINALGEEARVKITAANALGYIGDEEAVEPLIKLLSDEDDHVRAAAVEALNDIGDKRAVEPLTRVVKDTYVRVRINAIEALQAFQDQRATNYIIEVLDDKEDSVRGRAIDALGALKDEQAVEPLLKALRKADRETRFKIFDALHSINPEKGREAARIIDKLEAGEEDVSRLKDEGDIEQLFKLVALQSDEEAAQAIKEMGETVLEKVFQQVSNTEYLYLDADDVGVIVQLLKSFGEPAIEGLIRILEDEKRPRKLAIILAGEIKDPRLIDPLLGTLRDGRGSLDNFL